jgi:hypothetical protein
MNVDSINVAESSILLLEDQETLAAELGGDVGARISALLLAQSQERSEANQDARQATEERLRASEEQQVSKMREKASEIRTAGWVEGGAQMVGGTFQMAGGVCLMGGDKGASVLCEGAAQAATGTGKWFASQHQSAALRADADAVAAGHRAEEARRTLDDLRDDRKDIADSRDQATSSLSNLRQTQDATYQAALSQRA